MTMSCDTARLIPQAELIKKIITFFQWLPAREIMESFEPYRLSGRTLLQVRLAWTAAALLLLLPTLMSWLVYFSSLRNVCASCLLTPVFVETLVGMGIDPGLWTFWKLASSVLVAAGWMGTGIAIFALRSYDWRAVLMSILLMMVGPGFGGIPYELVAVQPEWDLIFRPYQYFSLLGILPLVILFPNGRLAPRWSIWPVLYLWVIFFPNSFMNGSPLDLFQWGSLYAFLFGVGPFMFTLCILPVYRYRKVFTHLERQQTRWALLGFLLTAAGTMATAGFFATLGDVELLGREELVIFGLIQSVGYGLSPLMIPVFIGIAILRSRLWNIDVLIRRTLVYGVLSGMLGLLYLGVVTVLQAVFASASGQSSTFAVVLSTLAIAALFNPLRGRIQDFIDRRFYRQKYNSEQALVSFARAARSETDLEELGSQMLLLVQKTVQPEHLNLWLKPAARMGGKK
jgi:hypothetical protein